MDPGICNHGDESVNIERDDVKEGQYLRYRDPSGIMPSIYVLEVRNESLKIRVGSREWVITPGSFVTLCRDGINYANFDLDIYLEPVAGFMTVDLNDVLAVARDRYKVFALSPEQIEALKQSNNKNDMFLLGRWYWLTYPEEGAYEKAEALYRKSAKAGCPDALMGLAEMYRSGDLGEVDMEQYVRLRDEAREKGSMMADLAYYEDLGDEEQLMEHMASMKPVPAEWYNVWGKILFVQDKILEAGNKFATSALWGYVEAHEGALRTLRDAGEMARAEKACCGAVYLYKTTRVAENKDRILENFETALKLGTREAAFLLAEIYLKGLYGVNPDITKALGYAQRGSQLGDTDCRELLLNIEKETV